jgi:hypothetical protein
MNMKRTAVLIAALCCAAGLLGRWLWENGPAYPDQLHRAIAIDYALLPVPGHPELLRAPTPTPRPAFGKP